MNDNFTEEQNEIADFLLAIQRQIAEKFFDKPYDGEDVIKYVSANASILASAFRFLLSNKFLSKETLLNIMQTSCDQIIKGFEEYEGE